MATLKGKIKINASSLAGGLVSSTYSNQTNDWSVSDVGKYVQDAASGVNILSNASNMRDSIMPNIQNDVYKDFGVNIGTIYDSTIASNYNQFFLTTNGNVIKLVANTYTDLGVITASSSADGSIWTHVDTAGTEKIFIAGNNGGNFLIKTMNTDGTGLTTVHTNATSSTANHRGVVGLLNRSYVTNGQYIMTYDPVVPTYTNNKLNIGVGWVTTSIRQYGNYMAITAYKANASSRLILWDGASEFANFQYEINDQYATCFVDSSRLIIFSSGRNGTSKLFIFNNSDISGKPFWETPDGNSYIVPEQSSVTSFNNAVHWRTKDGRMYCFGEYRGTYGVHSPMSTSIWQLNSNVAGLCKTMYSTVLLVPGSSSNSNGISNTMLSGYGLNYDSYSTGLASILFPSVTMPRNSTVEYIKVIFSRFINNGGGRDAYISFFYNDENGAGQLPSNGELRIRYSDLTAAGLSPNNYVYHVFNKYKIPNVNIFSLGMYMQYCAVREIEIGYTYDDLTL